MANTMHTYSLKTLEEVARDLAARVREMRLRRGWKQTTLAERSGVTLGSLRRFEGSGRISLRNLTRLAFALNRLDDMEALFVAPEATSISELEARQASHTPKRGRQ